MRFALVVCGLVGCGGTSNNMMMTAGGSFTARISGAAGANNSSNSFVAKAVSGSFNPGSIHNFGLIAQDNTNASAGMTQQVTLYLYGTQSFAAGASYVMIGNSSMTDPNYGTLGYTETTSSGGRSWFSQGGNCSLTAVSGSTVSLSCAGLSMVILPGSNQATGSFQLSAMGTVDKVAGL